MRLWPQPTISQNLTNHPLAKQIALIPMAHGEEEKERKGFPNDYIRYSANSSTGRWDPFGHLAY